MYSNKALAGFHLITSTINIILSLNEDLKTKLVLNTECASEIQFCYQKGCLFMEAETPGKNSRVNHWH